MEKSLQTEIFFKVQSEKIRHGKRVSRIDEELVCRTSYQCTAK